MIFRLAPPPVFAASPVFAAKSEKLSFFIGFTTNVLSIKPFAYGFCSGTDGQSAKNEGESGMKYPPVERGKNLSPSPRYPKGPARKTEEMIRAFKRRYLLV